jgi:hypothetical protein
MKRWMVQGKCPKTKKWISLFRNQRTYKTEDYAHAVKRRQEDLLPEVELRVVEVEVHKCKECGTVLK